MAKVIQLFLYAQKNNGNHMTAVIFAVIITIF